MPRRKKSNETPQEQLRAAALEYPGTEEGIACEGTALEKRTIKVRNKAFLFLGPKDAMLKLRESLPTATDIAAKELERCKVGAHGWVTVTFGDSQLLSTDVLLAWIDESYRLFAPRQLTAQLPARTPQSGR